MTEPSKPKTKSERIRELLDRGFTPREVAEKLNTTIEYVYKEKGKLRKKGLLITEQSLTISGEGGELAIIKGQSVDSNSNNSPTHKNQIYENGDYDISREQRNDCKSMYSSFENGKDASEVVALYGIRPDISEREYNRYLSIKSRNPLDFQNSLISGLQGGHPEIQSLLDKAGSGKLLTNNELLSIISFKTQIFASQYLKDAISKPTISLPGLNRIVCSLCYQHQPGVLLDVMSYAGKLLQGMTSGHVCSTCRRTKNEG